MRLGKTSSPSQSGDVLSQNSTQRGEVVRIHRHQLRLLQLLLTQTVLQIGHHPVAEQLIAQCIQKQHVCAVHLTIQKSIYEVFLPEDGGLARRSLHILGQQLTSRCLDLPHLLRIHRHIMHISKNVAHQFDIVVSHRACDALCGG